MEERQVGRYRLVERVGAGGMGEVWLAELVGAGGVRRRCAVKMMLPLRSSRLDVEAMFEREAVLASRIVHENVVQVFDSGKDGDALYLVMELVDGLTLRALFEKRRRLAVAEACALVADVARGLDAVHSLVDERGQPAGIVHRDVTPDNVLVTREGVAKIGDFGIAFAADMERLTTTGELKGKVPFMAPEQLDGGEVTSAADVFALGVTLTWLLAGRRPFDRATELATMNAIVREEPPPLRALRPDAPAVVEEIVRAMLAKRADERPPARRVAEVLAAVPGARVRPRDVVEEVLGAPVRALPPPLETRVMALPPSTSTEPPAFPIDDTTTPMRVVAPLASMSTAPTAPAPGPPEPAPARRAPRLALVAAGAVVAAAAAVVAVVVLAARAPVAPVRAPEPPATTATPQLSAAAAESGGGEGDTPASDALAAAAVPPRGESPGAAGTPDPPAPASESGGGGDEAPAMVFDAEAPKAEVRARAAPERRERPELELQGPASVTWSTLEGRRLGSGSLQVHLRARAVVAVEGKTGARCTVPVSNGVARFDDVGKGTLDVRANPYAHVYVGARDLGVTPILPPPEVPACTLRVRLVYETKTRTETVRVLPGKSTPVRVDME